MVLKVGRNPRDTQKLILDAAEDVFNEKGYANTSLENIADAVGMTRGAIYWNFKDKEDLVREMSDRAVKPVKEQIEGIVQNKKENPADVLKKIHMVLAHEMAVNSHFRKVAAVVLVKADQLDETGYIGKLLTDWRVYMSTILRNLLLESKQKMLLPEDLNIEMAADMLYCTFWEMVRSWFFFPTEFDIEECVRRLLEAFFDMFITGSHMKLCQQ